MTVSCCLMPGRTAGSLLNCSPWRTGVRTGAERSGGQDRSREIRGSGRGTGRTKQENRRSGQEQGDKIHDISGIRKRNRRTGGLDKNRGTMAQDKKQENRNRADRGLGQRTV